MKEELHVKKSTGSRGIIMLDCSSIELKLRNLGLAAEVARASFLSHFGKVMCGHFLLRFEGAQRALSETWVS